MPKTIEEIVTLATDIATKRDARISAVTGALEARSVAATSLATAQDAQAAEDASVADFKSAVAEYVEENVVEIPGAGSAAPTDAPTDAPLNAKKKN